METKTLYAKLYKIQQLALAVSKDWKNPHFKSAYPTLDNVIEVLTPELNKNWILITHFADQDVFVTRVVDVESWEFQDSRYTMLGTTPQQRGSEQTYFRRYSMIALFNLPSEDDDWNLASSWNYAPISNDVHQIPTKYPKSALDEVMEQMEVETDLEHLKTLYALGLDRVKTDKQRTFFDNFKEKQKKRILASNIHAIWNS